MKLSSFYSGTQSLRSHFSTKLSVNRFSALELKCGPYLANHLGKEVCRWLLQEVMLLELLGQEGEMRSCFQVYQSKLVIAERYF